MLHAKFKIIGLLILEKKIFKGFCYHGGHLGHVTLIIYINFHSPFLRMNHMLRAVSEKKIFEYYGSIHVYCPGVGADLPLGSILFSES